MMAWWFSFFFEIGTYAAVDGGRRSTSYSAATSSLRSSFPTGDFGIASTKTNFRGRLKFANPESRQNVSRSASLTYARRLTNAATIFPHLSSASPTTATSDTAGSSDRQLSISTGDTFSPPVMIMSSVRPVTNRSPSLSTKPVSPVKYQPSRSDFASASGRLQYPSNDSSPASSAMTSPSSAVD